MNELREVTTLFERGYLQPEVDRIYLPERFGDAIERLENAEQTGKIVIKCV
ncbi:MAG: zinc-binding dehydrogenase [Pseudomonadales bacterium]